MTTNKKPLMSTPWSTIISISEDNSFLSLKGSAPKIPENDKLWESLLVFDNNIVSSLFQMCDNMMGRYKLEQLLEKCSQDLDKIRETLLTLDLNEFKVAWIERFKTLQSWFDKLYNPLVQYYHSVDQTKEETIEIETTFKVSDAGNQVILDELDTLKAHLNLLNQFDFTGMELDVDGILILIKTLPENIGLLLEEHDSKKEFVELVQDLNKMEVKQIKSLRIYLSMENENPQNKQLLDICILCENSVDKIMTIFKNEANIVIDTHDSDFEFEIIDV